MSNDKGQAEQALALRDVFDGWYLPQRPLCCDRYEDQHRRAREDALKYRLIEPNLSALRFLIL